MDIKGRILIYSTFDCVSCIKAKQKFDQLGLPYCEVILESYPSLKEEVKRRTGKNTVPQIFFNEIYIGGFEDLQSAIADQDYFSKLMFLLQTKSPPSDAPRIPDPHTSNDNTMNESLGDVGEIDEMIQIVEEIQLSGIMKSHNLKIIKTKRNFFTGHDLLGWLYDEKQLDKDTALNVGQKLINRHLLHDVNHNIDETFQPSRIYRLLEDECQDALNSYNGSKTLPMTLCHYEEIFRQSVTNLYKAGKNESENHFFDYQLLSKLPEFKEYLNVITHMQRINFANSSCSERLTFFINVYNALVIHGKIEFGYPNNILQRYKFFKRCKYIIGGYSFSLNDIANGVLRSNQKALGTFMKPFWKQDARLNVSFPKIESLVHFALTFGSKSCPPFQIFNPKAIKSELQVAAESFLETKECLQVRIVNNVKEIKLNRIFKWYAEDFGCNKKEILLFIYRHLGEGERRICFKNVFDSNAYTLAYLPYDWSPKVET